MAHAATDTEDKVLQEEILTPESLAEEFPLVTLKVTYLGGHPRKTERLKGTIEMETDAGELDDRGRLPRGKEIRHFGKRMSKDGYTLYDFSSVDSRGRKTTHRMTEDGKRYEIVEHLAHALELSRKVDQDNQPIFQIRGEPEAIAVLRRYRDTVKSRVNPDHGETVLRDMKDLL